MRSVNPGWEEKLSSNPHPDRKFSYQLSVRIEEEIMMKKQKNALKRKSVFAAGIVLVIACFAFLYLPLSDSLFGTASSHTASPSNIDVQTVMLQGSSDHWSVEYIQEAKIESDFDNESRTRVVLQYKGDNPKVVGQIRYTITSSTGKMSGTGTLFEDGTLNTSTEGKNVALLSKDAVVQVEINWNDKTESFELRN